MATATDNEAQLRSVIRFIADDEGVTTSELVAAVGSRDAIENLEDRGWIEQTAPDGDRWTLGWKGEFIRSA